VEKVFLFDKYFNNPIGAVMKVAEILTEMAKGKNKRARAAKLARIKKAEKPTQDASRNPVHMAAQTVGAGEHTLKKGKGSESGKNARTRRKEELKKEIREY
jgi:hypothetical protein